HSALALDRFDHRRLFAADVGARAAPQVDWRQAARRVGLKRPEFPLQNRSTCGVFVAQIDINFVDVNRPRRDEHTLEETMRIALKIVTVLEGARLALVDVYRHQPWRRLGAHDAPFAPRRKPGTTQPAQRRLLELRDDRL